MFVQRRVDSEAYQKRLEQTGRASNESKDQFLARAEGRDSTLSGKELQAMGSFLNSAASHFQLKSVTDVQPGPDNKSLAGEQSISSSTKKEASFGTEFKSKSGVAVGPALYWT